MTPSAHTIFLTHRLCLGSLLFLFFLFFNNPSALFAAVCPNEAYVSIPSDAWIPNISHPCFTQGRTIKYSEAEGKWSASATWGGSLPTNQDVVVIRHPVILDLQTEVYDLAILNGGQLSFSTTIPTSLTIGTLLVMEGGTLEIGTTSTPIASHVSARILFSNRPLDPIRDPAHYGHGLLVFGTLTIHGAPLSDTFVRLKGEPLAGTSSLILKKTLTGWKSGDRLVIPDTRQLAKTEDAEDYVPQWESRTLQSISGPQLFLNQALSFDHKGARDGDGNLAFLPHVANLSRNVVLQSLDPTGRRGYVFLAHRANIDIRYAAFRDLGRTTVFPYDETTFDGAGNPTNIANNQLHRTPLTVYHLLGPFPPLNSHQYTLIGNAIDGGETDHPFRWCIGIINSHYGLIQHNVCYNTMGSGIAMWTGAETENVVDHNFVMRVKGTGAKGATSGIKKIKGNEGSGFYLKVNNRIRDNVATNIVPLPASIIEPIKGNDRVDWHGWRMGYAVYQDQMANKAIRIPQSPGSDPNEYLTVSQGLPLLEFSGNEVYGAVKHGLIKDYRGVSTDVNGSLITDYMTDFHVWHVHGNGYWGQMSNPITLDGFKAYGDKSVKQGVGINFHVAENLNFRVIHSDIQSLDIGMVVPRAPEFRVGPGEAPRHGAVYIGQTFFRNFTNIIIDPVARYNHGVGLPSRTITLADVTFQKVATTGTPYGNIRQYDIHMDFHTGNYSNLLVKNEVIVTNYNASGQNFSVYYLEQRPDFIVPETTYNSKGSIKMVGAPGPGLTNQDMVNNGNLPVAGEIAPCLNDTSYPQVQGFVCPSSGGNIDVTPPASPTGFREVVP